MCNKFNVHQVNVGRQLKPVSDSELGAKWSKFGKVESYSHLQHATDPSACPVILFNSPSLLAVSVYEAFFNHYPLKINPNAVWITIVQGFTEYVNRNAEKVRDKFVNFEGKETISVQRPDFVKGSSSNDWTTVFPEFCEKIANFVGKETQILLDCNFSNSAPVDKLVANIALMDCCKNYFNYEMLCGCGIPSIELLGSVSDWILIREKTEKLLSFSTPSDLVLQKWIGELCPVLDHFVSAAQGKPDLNFWGSVCNLYGLSGMKGSPITGWISVFYPYVKGHESSYYLSQWSNSYKAACEDGYNEALKRANDWGDRSFNCGCGVDLEDFPSGLSSAPVKITWQNDNSTQDIKFYGGLVAIYQYPDGALEACTGWAVIEASQEVEQKRKRRGFWP